MTTIVYVLLFLGTKVSDKTADAYTNTEVFSTEASCNNFKQALEVKFRSKFDKIMVECKKKEVNK